jgi:putative transposase
MNLSLFAGGRDKMPELFRDTENWKHFDESLLPAVLQPRVKELKRAIQMYCAFAPMLDVLKMAKMKRSGFMRIFVRCGLVKDNGTIVGWSALVKGVKVGPPVRRAPFEANGDGKAGYGGLWAMLLRDHPKIEPELITYLNARGKSALRPNSVTFRPLHKKFLEICREQGVGEEDYPVGTGSQAKKPLRKWFRNTYLAKHASRFVAMEFGPDAGGLTAYGEGDGTAKRILPPYRRWMLDATIVDILARYEFPNASGDWEELDLPRFIQLRIIDAGTGANLASRQVYAAQVSADDISLLIWEAINGPRDVAPVVHGLQPEEGAGYPAAVIPQLRYACCDELELDNALAHLANQVQHLILSVMGAMVVLGPPATPHERAAQESKFGLQARRVLHQLPGTTGSGPRDPVRKRAAVPLEGRIHAAEVEHILDVYAKNENALPTAASHNISSLERLRRQIKANVLVPKYLAPDKRFAHFFAKAVPVVVKSDLRTGRRPFVNYLYAKYSGDLLGQRFDLVGKRLWLRANPDNVRTAMLFAGDGTFICPVQALGRWGTFDHDARIRRIFGVLKRKGEMGPRADDHPLAAIFEQLQPQAAGNRKAALQLTYIVEYLKRHGVHLDEEVRPLASGWDDLKAAANDVETVAVMPVPPTPPASASPLRAVPKSAPRPPDRPIQPSAGFARRPSVRR